MGTNFMSNSEVSSPDSTTGSKVLRAEPGIASFAICFFAIVYALITILTIVSVGFILVPGALLLLVAGALVSVLARPIRFAVIPTLGSVVYTVIVAIVFAIDSSILGIEAG